MKLLRVGNLGKEKPAALDKEGKIRDLSDHINDFTPETLSLEVLSKLEQIDLSKLPELSNKDRIGSCIARPGNFYAIGLNYKAHAEETNANAPSEPIVFNKSIYSIIGPNDDVVIPKDSNQLDHEVEIALVIGKKGKYIKESEAQDYVLGYCICNDVSERDWQKNRGGQWVKGKSGDTFGPLGPYLVTKNEIKDIFNINLTLDLNGKRRQTGNTGLMIFNFNVLISHLSEFLTLMPGDLITTGTPAGVGLGMNPPDFLKPGDEMFLKVDDMGEQRNKIIKE